MGGSQTPSSPDDIAASRMSTRLRTFKIYYKLNNKVISSYSYLLCLLVCNDSLPWSSIIYSLLYDLESRASTFEAFATPNECALLHPNVGEVFVRAAEELSVRVYGDRRCTAFLESFSDAHHVKFAPPNRSRRGSCALDLSM